MIKTFIKNLFCIHKWEKIAGIYDDSDWDGHVGSLSKCTKCGKMKEKLDVVTGSHRYVHPLKKDPVYYPKYLKRGYDD